MTLTHGAENRLFYFYTYIYNTYIHIIHIIHIFYTFIHIIHIFYYTYIYNTYIFINTWSLRQFYIRRNVSGMSRRHHFFCSCTCVKILFTDTFLKCRFWWKVEIISTFPLQTNVAFFLSKSFLSIDLNKVSHYLQSIIQLKMKMNGTSTGTIMKYQKSFQWRV